MIATRGTLGKHKSHRVPPLSRSSRGSHFTQNKSQNFCSGLLCCPRSGPVTSRPHFWPLPLPRGFSHNGFPPEHILIVPSNSCRALFLIVKFLLKPGLIVSLSDHLHPSPVIFLPVLAFTPRIVFITTSHVTHFISSSPSSPASLLSLLLYTHCLDQP